MSALDVIDAYLAACRAIGVRLEREGRYLHQFARETGNLSLPEIGREAVARFLHGRSDPPTAAWKLKRSALAGLYRYAIGRGIVTVSPLPDHPPKFCPPQTPSVYSTAEVQRLLDATAVLDHPASRLQAMTYRTLLLLLYSTGSRVSEVISLELCDVDLAERVITVRSTKFYKTRIVPIGARLSDHLAAYLDRRRRLALPAGKRSALLCTRTGRGLHYNDVISNFQRIRAAAGIVTLPGEYRPPRLHDLRHTAAVHRVLAWYRAGLDVQRLLPALATYLGHVDIRSTQRYLQMTPELLDEANRRFARYAGPEVSRVEP